MLCVHLLEWFLFIWLLNSSFDFLAWVCVGIFLWLVFDVGCSFGCLFSVLFACNINKLQQGISNTQAWTCRVKQSNTSITLHHKNQTTTQILTLAPQHQQRTRPQSKTEHTSNQLKHTSLRPLLHPFPLARHCFSPTLQTLCPQHSTPTKCQKSEHPFWAIWKVSNW